ncbi:MAG TPA: bifunctional aspartate kinase/homoserine dehydrogenase I, partial [Sphaerochaeta sp.]|nr:bifunctional aspartate kinase/homoserine dehydrogenase I [Sphaerochaeta sp.]
MRAVRIHALESRNLLSKPGCERMVRIIQSYPEAHQVVVLAPLLDATLELSSLLRLAESRDEKLWSVQEQRFKAWNAVIEELLPIALGSKVMERIKQGFSDIEDILKSVWIVKESSTAILSHIEALTDSWVADLVTHWTLGSEIDAQLAEYTAVSEDLVARHRVLYVFGTLPQGEAVTTKTLRSEYAASLLACDLGASGVTFWNTSSLLKSADEREVPSAQVIRSLSYAEASELSFFGFPIIDPQALLPAINEEIAVELRYWEDESDPGSVVSAHGDAENASRVKGFSIMHNVA